MPTYIISDFRRGVDTRRSAWAAVPGSLSKGVNVHITPGGDIETRKAFVHIVSLPGSFGLSGLSGRLKVYGSAASAPTGLPSNFDYQQLSSPSGATMTAILDVEPFDGKNYVIAKYGDDVRHFYDGTRVKDWDTDVCRYRFKITAGTSNPGTNKVSSITVDGVELLDAAVNWTTSNAATAALIAASINTEAVYSAYVPAGSAEVVLVSPTTAAQGDAVVVTVGGDVTYTAISANGIMEAPVLPGLSVRTAGEKMYVTSGPNLYYSAVASPTNFSTDSTGGGFANMSTHSSGSEELMGAELFYNDLIIFAKDAVQRWHVEADDTQNERLQTFRGVGLIGPRAATSTIEGSTFFFDRTAVHAVQTKDSSGRSTSFDISKQINREMIAYVQSLAASIVERAILINEPEQHRLWVIVGERIYVRSHFPEDGIIAWTEYDPGFTIDDVAIAENRIYVRSGDDIYLYGGTTGDEYGDYECEVHLPYANFRAPATMKGLSGMDLGLVGEWSVYIAYNLDDLDAARLEAIVSGPTFHEPNLALAVADSHVSLRLVHAKAERGVVDSVAFNYKTGPTA